MSEYAYRVYEGIVSATNSELILFFVILALFTVPFYGVVLKGRKAEKQHQREQQQQLIDVIKDNTTVMAGLKVTLDTSKVDTKSTLERIHTRLDEQGNAITAISNDVARINTKFDNSLGNQTEIASKVNKILLIVSSSPQNGGEN